MNHGFLADERCADLLIGQATVGLTAAESTELEALLGRYPGADPEAFERTAAALALAALDTSEPLPATLRARLLDDGTAAVRRAAVVDLRAVRQERAAARAAPAARSGTLGWWAAAAAVLIAISGWYPRLVGRPPALAELRGRVEAAPGAVRWAFASTDDPGGAGASGDVVFDPATQQGYMRLRGLRPNDPRRSEYQLWIFDSERDDRYPVDGGVFDIPGGGDEFIVPITARVWVGKPVLFAVTVEHSHGVVVSAREHIVVVAKGTRA